MADCIFCKIVAGEIPATSLVETELALSFMDIAPVNPGHALVIPKRHTETLLDVSREELGECIRMVQRVARAVMAATGSVGCNLLQNTHQCAGQRVLHVHFHVIPRSPDYGFRFDWRQLEYGEGEMDGLHCRIRELL